MQFREKEEHKIIRLTFPCFPPYKVQSIRRNEEKKEGRYLRREFSYSKFQQTMVLPENAEKEKIEAKVENGVLNIIIPKMSEEAAKKAEKIIEIK